MSMLIQLSLAVLLIYVGLKRSPWWLKWPALACGALLAIRPVDELCHWLLKFVPPFLGA